MVISYETTSLLFKVGLLHNTEPHRFKCKRKAGVPKALSSVLVCYLKRKMEERFEKAIATRSVLYSYYPSKYWL